MDSVLLYFAQNPKPRALTTRMLMLFIHSASLKPVADNFSFSSAENSTFLTNYHLGLSVITTTLKWVSMLPIFLLLDLPFSPITVLPCLPLTVFSLFVLIFRAIWKFSSCPCWLLDRAFVWSFPNLRVLSGSDFDPVCSFFDGSFVYRGARGIVLGACRFG